MSIDNKFGWPLPPNFVQKDRIGRGEKWTWLDAHGIVHTMRSIEIRGTRYETGCVACDSLSSVCDYVRCNMAVTCLGCISAAH